MFLFLRISLVPLPITRVAPKRLIEKVSKEILDKEKEKPNMVIEM